MELTGRLTADAKVSEVTGGKKVVNFNIAINDSYKPKNGDRVEITTYVECAYWLNAGIADWLKKGLLVEIYGRIGSRAWNDDNGEAHSSITMNAANIKFLGKVSNGLDRADTKSQKKETMYDDENPF